MNWQEFQSSLFRSLRNLERKYFELERALPNTDIEIKQRERVYCYELYHQLRCNTPPNSLFTIHGEIDKEGQVIIHERIGSNYKRLPNPDFVIHQPGAGLGIDRQLAVIEVKPSESVGVAKANDDLKKLRDFVYELEYRHGIFLIFGPDRPRAKIRKTIDQLGINNPNLHVLWHKEVGENPIILYSGENWDINL